MHEGFNQLKLKLRRIFFFLLQLGLLKYYVTFHRQISKADCLCLHFHLDIIGVFDHDFHHTALRGHMCDLQFLLLSAVAFM